MNSKNRYNVTKTHFEKQDGKCFYCEEPCVLPDDPDERQALAAIDLKKQATFEHLYPKTDIRRMLIQIVHKENNGHLIKVQTKVMACRECNNKLGQSQGYLLNPIMPDNKYNKTILIDLLNGVYNNKIII